MTVVGDGSQTRDFTFVSDVTNAFLMAAESTFSGEAMNVGSGNSYSINYLVQLLEGDVVNIPRRPGEPDCTFGDTSKIKKLLAWAPGINFEDGVRIMTDQLDLWKEAPVWDKNSIENATKIWFKCLGD
jgi:UDP-glucose 4-epimerase